MAKLAIHKPYLSKLQVAQRNRQVPETQTKISNILLILILTILPFTGRCKCHF
jgi:hypothetical protein